MISPRRIAQGCRCKLLTGSYSGATRSCECTRRKDCKLTLHEQEILESQPKIIDARKRNWREYIDNRKTFHKIEQKEFRYEC